MDKFKCRECNICNHKNQCKANLLTECDFRPVESVKDYFTGSEFSGKVYRSAFKATEEMFCSTKSITLKTKKYCAYCGEEMYEWKKYWCSYDPDSGFEFRYNCVCDGAFAELEYRKRKSELIKKHNDELNALAEEFSESLKFKGIEKIGNLKIEQERRTLEFNIKHGYYGSFKFHSSDDEELNINDFLK